MPPVVLCPPTPCRRNSPCCLHPPPGYFLGGLRLVSSLETLCISGWWRWWALVLVRNMFARVFVSLCLCDWALVAVSFFCVHSLISLTLVAQAAVVSVKTLSMRTGPRSRSKTASPCRGSVDSGWPADHWRGLCRRRCCCSRGCCRPTRYRCCGRSGCLCG